MAVKIKILLVGGGTAGSVTPLLSVAAEIKKQLVSKGGAEFLWLGTKEGPEKKLVAEQKIKFLSISYGKWRRYFSWRNFTDLIFIAFGFFEALAIIIKYKPRAILSAGSFLAVPVALVGWFLRVPIFIHQQDLAPGLANKLMAPFACRVTVTFQESLKDFPSRKTIWTGNPARKAILDGRRERGINFFHLEKDLPTLLILGGGTGALAINNLIKKTLPRLTKFCQIIHLTGKGKNIEFSHERYHAYEFLTSEMADAYAVSDLIISRAGLGTLTELSALAKPAILIPMPASHQEANAEVFRRNEAAVVWSQNSLNEDLIVRQIKALFKDKQKIDQLRKNIEKIIKKGAASAIAAEIIKIVNHVERGK